MHPLSQTFDARFSNVDRQQVIQLLHGWFDLAVSIVVKLPLDAAILSSELPNINLPLLPKQRQ